MNLQFIHDAEGNTTGVFIPIEQWLLLEDKYTGLQEEGISATDTPSDWQKKLLDDRLVDYCEHPDEVHDFLKLLDDLEKNLRSTE